MKAIKPLMKTDSGHKASDVLICVMRRVRRQIAMMGYTTSGPDDTHDGQSA
jgi:hypothetical protein